VWYAMKSTQLDRDILNLLNKHKEGLPLHQIARMLDKDPGNLCRKLLKLVKHHTVVKIKDRVSIYKLELETPLRYFKVSCPKCHTVSIAESTQLTKVCPNPECKTKRGEQTRFWILQKRILEVMYI
jgi:DNA-binding Lrp family transcriptional regulator